MNQSDEKTVAGYIGGIKLPESDIQERVLAKVGERVRTRPRRRVLMIAVTFAAVWALIGAGVVMKEMVVFDFENGAVKIILRDPNFLLFSDDNTMLELTKEFYAEGKEGELRIVYDPENRSSMHKYFGPKITDYETLKAYISESDFLLPEYIPEGYEFVSAGIDYLLPPERDKILLTDKYEKDGFVFYIYELKEELRTLIKSLNIFYSLNAATEFGKDFIYYSVDLENSGTKQLMDAGSVVEEITTEYFAKFYIITPEKEQIPYGRGRVEISPIKTLPAFNLINNESGENETYIYDRLVYGFSAGMDGILSPDKIIKMAESLKPVR